eukprot:CAMPEP_0202857548 /NCGR_PEP_ID=MMETSP1391-20130828/449_1 /ASSEMBLY_ACC=CAM_ASM_000867 /TAXON_ID=1034604 /ORGANISM="Chlamydomonas leiostraca, Strain SAG 11-49" /LENGTH=88 /DNA_ID=CAMNT_0049536361 /DNA_START=93 /DNA_END=359 /DNA_ORIENTATION=+
MEAADAPMAQIIVTKWGTNEECNFLPGERSKVVREEVFKAFGQGNIKRADGITVTDRLGDLPAGNYLFFPGGDMAGLGISDVLRVYAG